MYLKTKIKSPDSRSGCIYTSGTVFNGIVIPASSSISTAGTSVDLSGYLETQIFTGYTACTTPVINAKLNTSVFTTFTGTTLPANYYSKTCADSRFVHLQGNETISGIKSFSDNIISVSGVCSPGFSEGLFGQGYAIYKDGDKYNLQIDNICARGCFSATEVVKNIARSTNGVLLVTDSVCSVSGLTCDTGVGKYYFNVLGDITVQSGQTICSQSFDFCNAYSHCFTVYDVDYDNARVYISENCNACVADMTFYRSSGSVIELNPYCNQQIFHKNSVPVLCLGELEGGCNLRGSGVDLCGNINAETGCIGGYTINNDSLSDGYVTLNANDHTIGINDCNGQEKILITNLGLSSTASKICGSCINIACACIGGDCLLCNTEGSYNLTAYIQQASTTNTAACVYPTCCSTRNFDVCTGNQYGVLLKYKTSTDYTLPDNSYDPVSCVCHIYSRCGTYSLSGTTGIYNCSNSLLGTGSAIWCSGQLTPHEDFCDNYENYAVINKNIITDTAQLYILNNYKLINNTYLNDCIILYNGSGCVVYSGSYHCPLTLCTNVEFTCVRMLSTVGKSEYASDGFESAWSSTNYLRYKQCENQFVINTQLINCHVLPARFCGLSANNVVSDAMTTQAITLTQTCVTSTPVTLSNCDGWINWNGSSTGVLCLPSSPVLGQMHVITNKASSYGVCVCSNKCFYYNSDTYGARLVSDRMNMIVLYNGTAWSILSCV